MLGGMRCLEPDSYMSLGRELSVNSLTNEQVILTKYPVPPTQTLRFLLLLLTVWDHASPTPSCFTSDLDASVTVPPSPFNYNKQKICLELTESDNRLYLTK